MPAEPQTILWPFVLYLALVLVLVGSVLGISALLGQRHADRQTTEPYEGGIVSFGSAQVRLGIRFYLIAAFFVIFDLESAFIFGWAIAVRQVGWAGFIVMCSFVVALVVGLIYLWRLGALESGSVRSGRRARAASERQEGVKVS